MQNTRTSKSLSAIVASATFAATKLNTRSAYEDILFIELISHSDTLAYQNLSDKLSSAQIEHTITTVRRILTDHTTTLPQRDLSPEIFYLDMLSALEARYPGADSISTLHALHYIISDQSTISSRTLAMMGVSAASLDMEHIAQPPPTLPIARVKPHPLARFGIELTELARQGKIDPVVGRERETQRVIEILARRKKNNPILIGEAGVGKSAVVEGLALRIASGDVPQSIANKRLFALDVSALVAGTKFRGEFEERIQQLLSAINTSGDAIIFLDEIHTIVGSGSTQGSLDTANILKPALARGEIQVIGATTIDEYRTNIEADAALSRRFNRVVVEPTTVGQSIEILRRVAPHYEEHHRVSYSSEALEACVKLSDRYISDRHLPDKAIDILDEAGARANIFDSSDGISLIKRGDVERIITEATGIPTEQLSGDELARLSGLERHLSSRVIGQHKAVQRLTRTIQRSRVGLADESRPIGVFMFVGATGVGKTLLAKELARWMFGESGRNLVRIDMSEYNEKHTVSRLIGSPPGYVGYGEGGELSEAVRRNPYSVILLDEIEKAHPEIFNIMLAIFDEGRLTDGAGRQIDLRNTIIIMTSNVGSQTAQKVVAPVGYNTSSKTHNMQAMPQQRCTAALERHFTPEFLNRIDEVIHFRSLEAEDIEQIIELELAKILTRAQERGYNIRVTPAARKTLASLGFQHNYGARSLRRTLLERVEEPISELIINGELQDGKSVVVERCRRGGGVRIKVA